MKYCTNCLMADTRPRISFDERGWCNACQWAEEKKNVDWSQRWRELELLCDKYRSKDGFDCIVPVSGGKDSSYVAYMMKHKLNMHPLCVTVRPGLALDLGEKNLVNFIQSGYDHIHLTPDPDVVRALDKIGFVEDGRPQLGWQTAVQAAIFRLAQKLSIPFVMFGEDGETEYGGTKKLKEQYSYSAEDSISIYLSGHDPDKYKKFFSDKELYWFKFPTADELRNADTCVAHWSKFEDWDPYEHYLVAKQFCGMQELEKRASATYNNFSQTDTALYNLHTWLMYLKLGFGRCTQDVGIDIRRGAMTRKQGLSLVKNFDSEPPTQFMEMYLEYFKMSQADFDLVIDKHTNKELFKKVEGKWVPIFTVE